MQFLTILLQNSCKWSVFTRTTQVQFKPVRFHQFFSVFFFMEWLNCNWKSSFFWSSPVSVQFFSGSMDWTFNPYMILLYDVHDGMWESKGNFLMTMEDNDKIIQPTNDGKYNLDILCVSYVFYLHNLIWIYKKSSHSSIPWYLYLLSPPPAAVHHHTLSLQAKAVSTPIASGSGSGGSASGVSTSMHSHSQSVSAAAVTTSND